MEWKYIVVRGGDDIIIFPASQTHAEVAAGRKVESAGSISFGRDADGTVGFSCYGRSTSLNVESRSVDSKLANRLLQGPNGYGGINEIIEEAVEARLRGKGKK